MLLFAALILRGYWIALHARDRFGSLLVVGITTLVAMQTFLNIGVVTGLLPTTGISLPFSAMAVPRCPFSWRRWELSCRYPADASDKGRIEERGECSPQSGCREGISRQPERRCGTALRAPLFWQGENWYGKEIA